AAPARAQQADRVRRLGVLLPYAENDAEAKTFFSPRGYLPLSQDMTCFSISTRVPTRVAMYSSSLMRRDIVFGFALGMDPHWGRRDGPETILAGRSLWCTAAIVGISPGTRSCLSHGSDLAFRGDDRNDSELAAARACPARLRCGPQPDNDDARGPAGAHAGASPGGDRHQARCRRRRLDRGYPGGQGSILDNADCDVFHRRGPNRQGS